MRSDYSKKSVIHINAQYHPSFIYGDFRDFRNSESCSEKYGTFNLSVTVYFFFSLFCICKNHFSRFSKWVAQGGLCQLPAIGKYLDSQHPWKSNKYLFSFPSSNSLTLSHHTAVLTGAVYNDRLLMDGGLLGEGHMENVLMVKVRIV